MAILCQHNRVLWVANLTSPREQQHFAFALIKCLFSELPQDWSVGLLYDIAFQIERSMQKHGILSDYHMCLMFAVSVFHVYVYHPCKQVSFGLTDGEGCEGFWSAMRCLIPSLRVSEVCADSPQEREI
ncbi:hypothetical protein K439DRAFT_1648297 [Ramaria rubella]|nr:hypothetical protein K439DRAFT_1648297 [Ramaria rubella]